jgi:hypothetical protein
MVKRLKKSDKNFNVEINLTTKELKWLAEFNWSDINPFWLPVGMDNETIANLVDAGIIFYTEPELMPKLYLTKIGKQVLMQYMNKIRNK